MLFLLAAEDLTAPDVAKAIGGPIVAAIIAGLVALLVSLRTTRFQRRQSIDTIQNKLIEMAIQYPHLERDGYCSGWPHKPADPASKDHADDRERYDNYCCYLFNMIRQEWLFAGKKAKKLADPLSIKEYIVRHFRWWEEEDENLHYYETEFLEFVDGIIREARKEKKIK